jgi:hypothetical protein
MAENVSTLSDVDSWTFDLNNEDDLIRPNNTLQSLSADDPDSHRLPE